MNLNEWRLGHQPRPHLQTIGQRTPGVAPQKEMAVASPIFQPTRSPKQHENRGIDPKHRGYAEESDSFTPVAVARVAF